MVSMRDWLVGVFSELRKWMNMPVVYTCISDLMSSGGILWLGGSWGRDIYEVVLRVLERYGVWGNKILKLRVKN